MNSGDQDGSTMMRELEVVLYRVDGGVSVSFPALKGCRSEGSSETEALDNLRSAIREYVDAIIAHPQYFVILEKPPESSLDNIPTINSSDAVKGFEEMGFRIVHELTHVTMTNGESMITIPRREEILPYTIAGIVRDVGLQGTVTNFDAGP
jgi:predicted RNase H-like HicB family nuclease